jgi:hypothetical protein
MCQTGLAVIAVALVSALIVFSISGRVGIITAPHTLRQITVAAGLTGFVCRPGRHCRDDKTKASSCQQQIAHGLFAVVRWSRPRRDGY